MKPIALTCSEYRTTIVLRDPVLWAVPDGEGGSYVRTASGGQFHVVESPFGVAELAWPDEALRFAVHEP